MQRRKGFDRNRPVVGICLRLRTVKLELRSLRQLLVMFLDHFIDIRRMSL